MTSSPWTLPLDRDVRELFDSSGSDPTIYLFNYLVMCVIPSLKVTRRHLQCPKNDLMGGQNRLEMRKPHDTLLLANVRLRERIR